jgi:hypothetical protein
MILPIIIWILAIYGLIEITIVIFNSISIKKSEINDMYILIAVKNQENSIEGIIRSIILKNIYYKKDELFNNIIVADMGSVDSTMNILLKLSQEYEFLKVVDCKESTEPIKHLIEK